MFCMNLNRRDNNERRTDHHINGDGIILYYTMYYTINTYFGTHTLCTIKSKIHFLILWLQDAGLWLVYLDKRVFKHAYEVY